MNISIRIEGSTRDNNSYELNKIADMLESDFDIPVIRERVESDEGSKDPALTAALTILGIAVSAGGTIISALRYLKSQEPKYSITISKGNYTVSLENIDEERFAEIMATSGEGNGMPDALEITIIEKNSK